jgi:hypothetical protein
MRRYALTILAFAAICLQRIALAETIVDHDLGFQLTLPEGFHPIPGMQANDRLAHGFVLGDTTDDKPGLFLLIENMHGTLTNERLDPAKMPVGLKGRLFTTTWQGFTVDAFEVPEEVNGVQCITYNVQIPLQKSAIQVKLFGPLERRAELDSYLPVVLAGLEGKSNWIPSVLPAIPQDSNLYKILLFAFAAAVIIGGLIGLWRLSRVAPKGTVLAAAIGIWVCSFGLEGIRTREAMLLMGSVRLLGFMGGILGIVDLLRRRKPTNAAPVDEERPGE